MPSEIPDCHRDDETVDLLVQKERLLAELRLQSAQVEHELSTYLEPTLDRQRRERDALEARLEHAQRLHALKTGLERQQQDVAELRQACETYAAEIDALRKSWSWKLTAPLRAAYRFVLRFRRRPPA